MIEKIADGWDKIIMGIDPGTNIMGYGILGVRNNRPFLIEMDVINLKKHPDTYLKLSAIYDRITSLVETFLPDEMAIEAPFYGKNVQSMLKLGRAQGVAIAAALARQVPIREYEPRKVKLSVTGNGAATKEQVREMLVRIMKINPEQLKKELDASDALAIALCHLYESSKIVSASSVKSWEQYLKLHPEKIKR